MDKKISNKVAFLVILATVIIGTAVVTLGYEQWRRININQTIDNFEAVDGLVYRVINFPTSIHDYFIPNNTAQEWEAFKSAARTRLDEVDVIRNFLTTQIFTGGHYTCAFGLNDSNTYCWGYGITGQLGNGTTQSRNLPYPTSAPSSFLAASASSVGSHTCAIAASNNRVYCWGNNGSGQLGDGTTIQRNLPTMIAMDFPFTAVATGNNHSCGIRQDNQRIYCWGSDQFGQLGNGAGLGSLTPVQINNNAQFLSLTAGDSNTCAVIVDGNRVLCWGTNANGQIGNGVSGGFVQSPTYTSDTNPYVMVKVGRYHACGIRQTDNRVYCWGGTNEGALGIAEGLSGNILNPTQIYYDWSFESVATGVSSTCAIRNDEKLFCWGDNINGQVGNGLMGADVWIPSEVMDSPSGSEAYAYVSTTISHTCAIRSLDNQTYCWGTNFSGQLGDGTNTNHFTPQPVQEN